MNGRYVLKTQTQNGEVSVLFSIFSDKLKIELLEMDMELKPINIEFSNSLIKIKTNFYRAPGIIHEMQLVLEKDHYNVSGSLAIVGN